MTKVSPSEVRYKLLMRYDTNTGSSLRKVHSQSTPKPSHAEGTARCRDIAPCSSPLAHHWPPPLSRILESQLTSPTSPASSTLWSSSVTDCRSPSRAFACSRGRCAASWSHTHWCHRVAHALWHGEATSEGPAPWYSLFVCWIPTYQRWISLGRILP